jgi:NAD(P)-dependent dehydrogenase (short-subunit alcohol dehydrogenase family)
MLDVVDRVVVVTGAASGIGFALAEKFAAEGNRVVLSDIEEADLAHAVKKLTDRSFDASGVLADVSSERDMQALADTTLARHGAIHILCNNAAINGAVKPLWELTIKDWEWFLDVNVWSVIWGIRIFVPLMLAQDTECHIVNTSSIAGVLPGGGAYGVTKHAVVALSEGLYYDLRAARSRIGVSVLLPGLTQTRHTESELHRPEHLSDQEPSTSSAEQGAFDEWRKEASRGHFQRPSLVAEKVLDCIRKERFWIVPNEIYRNPAVSRIEHVFEGINPLDLEELLPGMPGIGW